MRGSTSGRPDGERIHPLVTSGLLGKWRAASLTDDFVPCLGDPGRSSGDLTSDLTGESKANLGFDFEKDIASLVSRTCERKIALSLTGVLGR